MLNLRRGNLPRAARPLDPFRSIVFDDLVPAPDRDAGGARMALILKSLAGMGPCTFIAISKLKRPEYEEELKRNGVEIARLADYRRLLKERDFRIALMSRADVAGALLPSIKRLAPRTKTIFDTVDLNFVRLERERSVTGNRKAGAAAQRYRKLEKRLAGSADQVWCVTAADAATLAREAPGARFAIIPTIHPLKDRGQDYAARGGLVFLGSYLHRPNVDAVHYFMREIYPAVCAAIPSIKVNIVGAAAPPEFERYASATVTITGYLADLAPLFQQSRIFVAPLRFGSGMKGKIGEALSYGLPVVTTSVGAEGMELTNEQEVLIADDTQEFAAAVIRLYRNGALWRRLSDHGYRHIAQHFTPEIIEEKIRRALENVLGNDLNLHGAQQ